MTIFYFSGTGNSLHVAKAIGGKRLSIPQLINQDKFDFCDDVIGFVFPCYSMGMPQIVLDFVKKGNFKADYYFAIMTHGNVAGAGLQHIERIFRKKKIKFNYTRKIHMIDNFLSMYKIEDQLASEQGRKIPENIESVVQDIKARKHYNDRKNKVVELSSRALYKASYTYFMKNNYDKYFYVDETCNGCGVCAKVCPRGNIKIEGEPKYSHKCDACLSCINNCPKKSMHLKSEKSAMRFRNQHVELKEIIDSNNQGRKIG